MTVANDDRSPGSHSTAVASKRRSLLATPISAEAFAPFGQLVEPTPDGQPFGADDAQLAIDRGTPRFYIMRLHHRDRRFHRITRHRQCTQCLGSLGGEPWYLAVAPPSQGDRPHLDLLQAFAIPGTCFVKLHVGTWHAGPYFDAETADFYNLELSDTNIADHQTFDLRQHCSLQVDIIPPPASA
ncbi:MAG: ureidoglycolate lyase [Cyanobacteria bacterium J06639_1]